MTINVSFTLSLKTSKNSLALSPRYTIFQEARSVLLSLHNKVIECSEKDGMNTKQISFFSFYFTKENGLNKISYHFTLFTTVSLRLKSLCTQIN